MSAAFTPGGLGGRVYSAKGRVIRVEPKETRKANNVTTWSLGFQFATLEEYVEPDNAAEVVAEYLSCPTRAAAPELYEALSVITINAGLIPDPATGESTDCYAVPIDDIEAAIAALARARGEHD